MITEKEMKECDDILRYGKIITDKEFTDDGNFIRRYVIRKDSTFYWLVKKNGAWTEFEELEPTCENCRHAIYDSVPYGMGSASILSDCGSEDAGMYFTEDDWDDIWCDGKRPCPYWKPYDEPDYLESL